MMFAPGTLCFELAKGLPAAFVALVVGCIAAYIAWRQYYVARTKLKLDLFEKRYAIFEKVWGFLSEPLQVDLALAPMSSFNNLIPQAGFLFGKEVETYLNEAYGKRTDLWVIAQQAKANSGVIGAQEQLESHAELMKWFYEEASSGAKHRFSPYLNFDVWR